MICTAGPNAGMIYEYTALVRGGGHVPKRINYNFSFLILAFFNQELRFSGYFSDYSGLFVKSVKSRKKIVVPVPGTYLILYYTRSTSVFRVRVLEYQYIFTAYIPQYEYEHPYIYCVPGYKT